jgi:hypothetical protein
MGGLHLGVVSISLVGLPLLKFWLRVVLCKLVIASCSVCRVFWRVIKLVLSLAHLKIVIKNHLVSLLNAEVGLLADTVLRPGQIIKEVVTLDANAAAGLFFELHPVFFDWALVLLGLMVHWILLLHHPLPHLGVFTSWHLELVTVLELAQLLELLLKCSRVYVV